jgi:hypothetical protein
MGMYDKLGDMLNDFLATGRMPPPRKQPDDLSGESPCAKPAPDEKKIPEYLIGDFYELGFTNLLTTPKLSQVKKKYRSLMKSLHPDTGEADGVSASVEDKKRLTALVDAFKRVSAWLSA